MKDIFRDNNEASVEVKKLYPNMKKVPVAAFGISYTYYEDDTYSKEVAQTLYTEIPTDTFVGVKVKLVFTA